MSKGNYGQELDGADITPPKGWELVDEGKKVPNQHREYLLGMWAKPRRCRSTMTPIWACVWGVVRAYARPIK